MENDYNKVDLVLFIYFSYLLISQDIVTFYDFEYLINNNYLQ